MRLFTICAILLFSCTRTDEQRNKNNQAAKPRHMLDFIPYDRIAVFKAIRNDNAIALLLKRVDSITLEYKIELNRQWKGSQFDSGTVEFTGLRGDSLFIFDGSTIDCKLRIMLFGDTIQRNLHTQIERSCSDSIDNIRTTEIPMLWSEHNFR